MPEAEPVVLDSNIFISSHKGNEKFSEACTYLIEKIKEGKLVLAEPTILLAEVIDAIGRYADKEDAKAAEKILLRLVAVWIDCDKEFCARAGHTGYKYKIYGCDAIYAQVALDFNAPFISLDVEGLVEKLKAGGARAHSAGEFAKKFR